MIRVIEKTKKIVPYIVIVILTFIISLTLVSNPFSEVLARHDSSMFTYFGYAMNNGKIMYTEIFDHKGPIIFILNYIGVLLSTANFTGVYMIEFLSLFLFFVFTYWLSKLWLQNYESLIPLIVEAIVLVFFLEGGNLTEEYALPFIAYSLYVFIKFYKFNKKIVWYEILFLGISFSIVFLLRANIVSLWVVFCLIILIDFVQNKEYKDLLKVTLLFLSGVLAVIIPISLYLYSKGALEAGVFQSLVFNFMYLDSSAEKNEAIRVLYTTISSHHIIALFSVLLALTVYNWKNYTKNEKIFSIGAILFMMLSFYTSVMSGRDYKHYLMAMIPTMSLPIIFILKELKKNMSQLKIIFLFIIILPVMYVYQLNDIYEMIYTTNIATVNHKDGINEKEQNILNNKNKNEASLELAKVIKENTKNDDKIYIHRKGGQLYLLSDRLSSTKYFNLPAIDLNKNQLIGQDFIAEITNADTKLIVLDSNFNNKDKKDVELKFYKYVINNYKLIFSNEDYFIYKKK